MDGVQTDERSGGGAGRDVAAEVIRSVAAMARRDPADIAEGTRFAHDLDFDSTNILELLMRLENDLDIEFDPETFGVGGFETVGSLAAYVKQHLPS